MVLIRLAHAADLPSGEDLAETRKAGAARGKIVADRHASQPAKTRRAARPKAVGSLAVKPEAPRRSRRPAETRAFSSFADIIALVVEKRDVKLKGDLERLVRPIRVSPGQIRTGAGARRLSGACPARSPASLRPGPAGAGWCWWPRRAATSRSPSRERMQPRSAFPRGPRAACTCRPSSNAFPAHEIVDVRDPET